jgi:Stress responsive A/B Barrel Domain
VIRHVVFTKLRNDLSANEIEEIFAELAALQPLLPGLLAFSGGLNLSPEGLDKGYSHGFTVDFTDAVARDAYLIHPAHQKAGARLVAATAGGIEGLAVLDFAVG